MTYQFKYMTDKNIARERERITTRDEAEQFAVKWQDWASKQSLSIGEIADWAHFFEELAERFNLTEEFEENGII